MTGRSAKSLLVLTFSVLCLLFFNGLFAQDNNNEAGTGKEEKTKPINPSKIILEHVSDSHEFHFFNIGDNPVAMPLPVILYQSGKGLSVFMSSAFHHGEETYNDYILVTEEYLKKN